MRLSLLTALFVACAVDHPEGTIELDHGYYVLRTPSDWNGREALPVLVRGLPGRQGLLAHRKGNPYRAPRRQGLPGRRGTGPASAAPRERCVPLRALHRRGHGLRHGLPRRRQLRRLPADLGRLLGSAPQRLRRPGPSSPAPARRLGHHLGGRRRRLGGPVRRRRFPRRAARGLVLRTGRPHGGAARRPGLHHPGRAATRRSACAPKVSTSCRGVGRPGMPTGLGTGSPTDPAGLGVAPTRPAIVNFDAPGCPGVAHPTRSTQTPPMDAVWARDRAARPMRAAPNRCAIDGRTYSIRAFVLA
jgi:hypothetical protein